MKKKILSAMLSALLLAPSFVMPVYAVPDETEDYLSSMSTEDKISTMIMPVFRYCMDAEGNKTNVTGITDDIEAALRKHSFSGVILMGQNTPTNENTVRLTDALQKANAAGGSRPQLLISIDQEGGTVSRLGQGTVTSGNMALGAANDLNLTQETASIIGNELKALGLNADFAPDVDVNSNPANPVIGVRSFSDDPQLVAQHGAAFVNAMNETGVISTLKHFPGHGDTDTDSHTGLPCVFKSYDELKQVDLVPFQACIDAGSQMIMTAHIQYPLIETSTYRSKLTGEDVYIPATLSKTIITDILRGDMGFDGVVITDAMEMDAIAKHFDKYDAAKLAIEAGVDIMLMPFDPCTSEDFDEFDTYISTLSQMADNGEISMEKIDAAVTRILTLKKNNGLFTPYDGSDIEQRVEYAVNNVGTRAIHDREWEITEKAITLVKNDNAALPLTAPDQKTVILVPYDDETIPMDYAVRKLTNEGKLPEGAVVESYSYRYKTLEDMLPLTEDADNVIFLSEIYSASALQGDIAKMGDTICDTIHSRGGKFIVMSVNLPYDAARFQDADAIMLAYLPVSMPVDPEDKTIEMQKYGANMPVALYMMFSKDNAPTAKLPVNIPKLDENYCYTDTILYERGYGLTYLSDPNGEYSAEYMSSPFYEKLVLALDDSRDKTTMEKTLAVALSQEGYKNYSTQGIDIDAARSDGLIWTGRELRMNNGTGNTEYTRWAQNIIMNSTGSALYLDCDWCAIFVSWCMYQAGYYTEEQLKNYYYSYCADPRIEYAADSWITAFCLEQEKVWYTPLAERKLNAYNWNTYYHTNVEPYELPYRPGGHVYFSFDGSGTYFDHVAIVIGYDPETHVLTYTNGNSGGQVITKQMDLDTEEEFYGQPFMQNSKRIMAYAEYDEIVPPEQKEITSDSTDIIWYKDSDMGLRIQTNSDSKIASVFIDDEYLGSNLESNMIFNGGKLSIGKSELMGLETGTHQMKLVFDDGLITIALTIEDTKIISAEPADITWDRSEDSIVIRTNSESDTLEIRIGENTAATDSTEGVAFDNGTVTLSGKLANTILADGENIVTLVFADGEVEISIFVTNKEAEQSSEPSKEQSVEPSDEPSKEQSDEPSVEPSKEQSDGPSEGTSEQSKASQTSEHSINPNTDPVKTGDTSSAAIILALLTASLASAFVLAKRHNTDEK